MGTGLTCGHGPSIAERPAYVEKSIDRTVLGDELMQTRDWDYQILKSKLRSEIQKSKLRSGRDDNRLTEDDIAKLRLGPRGVPGEPAQPNALRESETQIPKCLDPGHTA